MLIALAPMARAQWRIQSSGTNASLRGIHAVDGEVAWASGSSGTVLHTQNGGQQWQTCPVPPGADKLDFRAVWAWDAEHAMVMSSGPGQQSRLYSTHDGCRTWRLVWTNPDSDGFWDSLQFDGTRFGAILGDPVHGSFTLFATYDGGSHWTRQKDACLQTMEAGQGAFAASNQSMAIYPISDRTLGEPAKHQIWFGASAGWLYGLQLTPLQLVSDRSMGGPADCVHLRVLRTLQGAASGIFAVGFRDADHGVAVGGDYTKPHNSADSAGYTNDGEIWSVADRPPSGYRSTVAWDPGEQAWIAAGPTGSDLSRDNGKTWTQLDQGNWNAISLPFAVGSDGRIARLISWGQLRAFYGTRGHHTAAGQ